MQESANKVLVEPALKLTKTAVKLTINGSDEELLETWVLNLTLSRFGCQFLDTFVQFSDQNFEIGGSEIPIKHLLIQNRQLSIRNKIARKPAR